MDESKPHVWPAAVYHLHSGCVIWVLADKHETDTNESFFSPLSFAPETRCILKRGHLDTVLTQASMDERRTGGDDMITSRVGR